MTDEPVVVTLSWQGAEGYAHGMQEASEQVLRAVSLLGEMLGPPERAVLAMLRDNMLREAELARGFAANGREHEALLEGVEDEVEARADEVAPAHEAQPEESTGAEDGKRLAMQEAWEAGVSGTQIARRFGVSTGTPYKMAQRLGWQRPG
jgi:hypothetical protein